jgi:hypothetical protein
VNGLLSPKIISPFLMLSLQEYAQKNGLLGDQEKCYVLFMKFLNCADSLGLLQTSDFRLKKKIKVAIQYAEKLKLILSKRYSDLAKESIEDLTVQKDHAKIKKSPLEISGSFTPPDPKGEEFEKEALHAEDLDTLLHPFPRKDQSNYSGLPFALMQPKQLIELLSQNSSVLLLDVRPEFQYMRSHVKASSSINIPEEVFSREIGLKTVYSYLNEEDRNTFRRRRSFSHVVILNRDFSASESYIPASRLLVQHFADCLTKFDFSEEAISSLPFVVDGGIKALLIQYPYFCTNYIASELWSRRGSIYLAGHRRRSGHRPFHFLSDFPERES